VTEVTQTREERLPADVQPDRRNGPVRDDFVPKESYFEPRYDKVDQQITSPVAGTIKLVGEFEETYPVGTLIAEIRGDE
jgi:hypothetical protein